jgi:uncharacterized membrane protein
MRFKTVQLIEWITCIILPVVLALTIIYKIWYLPFIFLFAAMVMFGILISRLKEVYQDERTRVIEEKGGAACVRTGCILMIIAGTTLLGISQDNTSGLGIAAITLFIASYALSLINLFTELYYKAKLGGR